MGLFKKEVVLANPKTVLNDRYAKKEVKEKVIRADQLLTVIRKMNSESKELKSSMKNMMESGQWMLNRNLEYDGFASRYEKLAQMIEDAKSETTQELVCPRCGSPLILRTAKKGDNAGEQFYGCSAFPKCRYVKNL